MNRLKFLSEIPFIISILFVFYVYLDDTRRRGERELELVMENNRLRMRVQELASQKDTIRTYVYKTDTIVRCIYVYKDRLYNE